jgi:drug/metabolite transporter (DMT)-like permease
MVDPHNYVAKYLWWRCGSIALFYALYLALRLMTPLRRWRASSESDTSSVGAIRLCDSPAPAISDRRRTEIADLRAVFALAGMDRRWVVVGTLSLAVGMSTFIASMTMVPAAMVLSWYSLGPFFSAALEHSLLGVRVGAATLFNIALATSGIALMVVADGWGGGDDSDMSGHGKYIVEGNVLALVASVATALYTVSLRAIPRGCTPRLARPGLAFLSDEQRAESYGVIMSLYAALTVVGFSTVLGAVRAVLSCDGSELSPFATPARNIALSVGHGVAVFSGFVMYCAGAEGLDAAELMLLSMMEVVGGVGLAAAVLGEAPSSLGLVGVAIVVLGVLLQGRAGLLASRAEDEVARHDASGAPATGLEGRETAAPPLPAPALAAAASTRPGPVTVAMISSHGLDSAIARGEYSQGPLRAAEYKPVEDG